MLAHKINVRLLGGPNDGMELQTFGELVLCLSFEHGRSIYVRAFSDSKGFCYLWDRMTPVSQKLKINESEN